MNIQLLLLVLLLVPRLVGAQPVVWDGKAQSINMTRQVSILEDPKGQLTIDQVSSAAWSGQFRKPDKEILQLGFTQSVHWLRFSVQNTTTQQLFLELPQALLPTADLYVRDGRGHWQVLRAGYWVNLYRKPIKNIYQIYPLLATTAPVYLRLLSYSQPFPVNLWEEQAFLLKANNQLLTYGIYVGIMLFVMINNLFLFFSLRRFTYLLYVVVVFFYILNAAIVMEGFILYPFPDLDLRFWFLLTPMVSTAFTAWFGVQFLELQQYRPRLYRIGIVAVLLCLAYSVLCVTFIPPMAAEAFNPVVSLMGMAFSIMAGIQAGRAGNRIGYPYALSYTIFFLLILIEAIYNQTGFPPHLTEVSHVTLSMLIEVLALAFMLSARFEWERKNTEQARADAQQELLEKTHENERILQAQNETLEREVNERTKVIAHKSLELQQSLDHLQATQNQLIQKEKMASLGELTAGIAHEIQNPLNFVNNFSAVSVELLGELTDEVTAGRTDEVLALADNLTQNLQKITLHGNRASSIVRGMLEHSRTTTGERQPTDINALTDEYLRLAYQGLRAKNKADSAGARPPDRFNAELVTDFAPDLDRVNVVPQDIGRVLLNLFNNAFYAVNQQQRTAPADYQPRVRVSTKHTANGIEIRIADNGTGIPETVKAKIFQPFFTTKPTGEGTGLGLSLSYDIITKGHGGTLAVTSTEGVGSEFVISLKFS